MRLVLTFVGKIIGLLGAISLLAAFGSLAGNDSAGSRWLRFVWILAVGIFLVCVGTLLMKKGKDRK